jgi:hypothetical protein
MSLPFNKALDRVKKFDGENLLVTEFTVSITRAMKMCKDTLDDETWIDCIIDDCLSGRALLFIRSIERPKKVTDLIKIMDDKFLSPYAKAEAKTRAENIKQDVDETCTAYLERKVAAMLLVPGYPEAEKLMACLAGFRDDVHGDMISATSVEGLLPLAEKKDMRTLLNKPAPSNAQPQVNAVNTGRQKFNGECYYCHNRGHKESECRKKKRENGLPSTVNHNGANVGRGGGRGRTRGRGGRYQAVRQLDANNYDAGEEVQLLDLPPENKTAFMYSSASYCLPSVVQDQAICSLSIHGNAMPESVALINSIKCIVGWDCGATISAISKSFFEKLPQNVRRHMNKTSTIVRAANHSLLRSLGSISLFVDFGESNHTILFQVLESLSRDVIVGNNFMSGFVNIDQINGYALFANGKRVPFMNRERKLVRPRICVAKETLLHPAQAQRVPVIVCANDRMVLSDTGGQIMWIDGLVDSATKWVYAINKSSQDVQLNVFDELEAQLLPEHALHLVDVADIKPSEGKVETPKLNINPQAPKEAREKLLDYVRSFNEKMSQLPWGTSRTEHRFRLKEEFKNRCNAYVYGPKEKEFMSQKIKEMQEQGIIRKSKESNVSPVVVAHHPRTKKMRFCVNYQKLNQVTIRENHVMPRVWDTLQVLAGSDWFSSIDLLSGFWQVPIAKEDVHLTAFISNEGIFEYLFMPFGLVNAPFTFQELMDDTLGDLKPNVAVPYLDDLNCHSAGDAMAHVGKLKLVFDRLLNAGLRPNWEKCKFLYPELDCFGHIVMKNGIRIDPSRLERLKGIKKLDNVRDVRLFLGLCCVYYRFIPRYSTLAEPLIDLTRKDVAWKWTAREIQALEGLKKAVIDATFLSIPRQDLPFRIRMDSSDYAAGYYLFQNVNNQERIIAFGGKTLNSAQRGYGPGHKEMYAIYLALKEFRWCVYGRKVYVQTDHEAWSWVKSMKQPPKACASWLMELLDYNPEIDWIPGKFNTIADVLSRLWKSEEFSVLDVGQLSQEEKMKIVKRIHGDATWGDHLGSKKTLEKLQSRFFWPGMRKDVETVCDGCMDCKVNKKQRAKAKMTPIVALRPWNIVGGDIVGPFPASPSHDYRYILIVVCYFSKYIELIPMENATGSLVTDLMRRKIFARYGVPSLFISDDGVQFATSNEFKSLLMNLNIARANAAVEHQQANGEVEAMVRLIKPLLRIKAQNDSAKWPFCLEDVMASRNSAKSASTGVSPFFALHGYEPVINVEAEYRSVDPVAKERFDKIAKSIQESKEAQKLQYDKGSTKVPSLAPNDKVLVRKFGYRSALDPVYDTTPSVVLEKRGENSYNVQRSNGAIVPVNVKDLKQSPISSSTAAATNTSMPAQRKPKPWDVQAPPKPAVIPAKGSVVMPSGKPAASTVVAQDQWIGRRVKVWWPQFRKYYLGTVVGRNNAKNYYKDQGSHIVRYDDDKKEYYEWLSGTPPKGQSLGKFEFLPAKNSSRAKQVDYRMLDKTLSREKLFEEDEEEDTEFFPASSTSSESFSTHSESEDSFDS